jgi:hypothetical protein
LRLDFLYWILFLREIQILLRIAPLSCLSIPFSCSWDRCLLVSWRRITNKYSILILRLYEPYDDTLSTRNRSIFSK